MLELNTSKQKKPVADAEISEDVLQKIKSKLREFYIHDTARLDELLGTDFFSKWFGHEIISKD